MKLLHFIMWFSLLTIAGSMPIRNRGKRANSWFYAPGDGHYYHRSDVRGRTAYMKCSHYDSGCPARAVWHRGGPFILTIQHECEDDPEGNHVLVQELRNRILDRCQRMDHITFRDIIREESRGYPMDVQLQVTYRGMRSSMRLPRLSNFPRLPQTLHEFSQVLQNPNVRVATMTNDGLDNLYAGSVRGRDGSHSILFASRRMIEFSRRQPIFFADGTFRSTPPEPETQQIFTILTQHDHHVIPIAWAFMESRTIEAYVSVLRFLRILLGRDHAMQMVVTDYEQALQIAWLRVFGPDGVILQGCLWLFGRALVRYAKRELGLARYMRGGPIPHLIRLCIALALVPLYLVRQAFRLIILAARHEGMVVYQRVRPFLDYVMRRWVSHRHRRMWMNCCGSEHRTNNISEAHNRQMNRHIRVPHPNAYMLISALADLEEDAMKYVEAVRRGQRIHRPRNVTSVANDARLQNYLEPQRLNDLLPVVQPNLETLMRYLERVANLFRGMYDQAMEDM